MAVENFNIFTKYFAILPVIKIGWLDELKKYYTSGVPKFDPSIDVKNLVRIPGMLSWNTSDERANYRYTDTLYHNLMSVGAPVEDRVLNKGGHCAGNIDYLYNFLNK